MAYVKKADRTEKMSRWGRFGPSPKSAKTMQATSGGQVRAFVLLPPRDNARLKAAAKSEQLSISGLLRRLVMQYLGV